MSEYTVMEKNTPLIIEFDFVIVRFGVNLPCKEDKKIIIMRKFYFSVSVSIFIFGIGSIPLFRNIIKI